LILSTLLGHPPPRAGLLSLVLHLDHHMSGLIEAHGPLTYAILWAIVFCETGKRFLPLTLNRQQIVGPGA